MINGLYPIFRSWSEKGSIYIISDTHFEDEDCKIMDPNWITPQEHIDIINKQVHKNDTLIHLGDVGNKEYIKQLKAGHKVLITGNHDRGVSYYEDVFDEVYGGPLTISDKIILSHEPIDIGSIMFNIHGHDHSGIEKESNDNNHLNLAANVVNYIVFNLGKGIKNGLLKNVYPIHRKTVDKQIYKSWRREKKEMEAMNNEKSY